MSKFTELVGATVESVEESDGYYWRFRFTDGRTLVVFWGRYEDDFDIDVVQP